MAKTLNEAHKMIGDAHQNAQLRISRLNANLQAAGCATRFTIQTGSDNQFFINGKNGQRVLEFNLSGFPNTRILVHTDQDNDLFSGAQSATNHIMDVLFDSIPDDEKQALSSYLGPRQRGGRSPEDGNAPTIAL